MKIVYNKKVYNKIIIILILILIIIIFISFVYLYFYNKKKENFRNTFTNKFIDYGGDPKKINNSNSIGISDSYKPSPKTIFNTEYRKNLIDRMKSTGISTGKSILDKIPRIHKMKFPSLGRKKK